MKKTMIVFLMVVIVAGFLFADDDPNILSYDLNVGMPYKIAIRDIVPSTKVIFYVEDGNDVVIDVGGSECKVTGDMDEGAAVFFKHILKGIIDTYMRYQEDGDTIVVSEIVRVYDGDTFYCNIHQWPKILGENIGIRVNGIDTPEMRGSPPEVKELAKKAKAIVFDCLTNADEVVLKNIKRGKYFRVVADVEFDGKDLATELIKAGLAKRYDGGTKDIWTVEDVNLGE